MLIKPMYQGTINTSQDMLKISAQLLINKGSATEVLVKEDPRPSLKKLYETRILAPHIRDPGFPDYLKEGY